MEIKFSGKRALVTGAAGGIGRDIAKQLTKYGADVVALDISQSLLDSLKKEVPSIHTIAVDLSNWTATRSVLEGVGNIDLLVNCAGIAILEPLTEITEGHVDKTFDINIKAIINITGMVAKSLLARKSPGSIVNISSQASMCGLQDHAVYCATKGAVDAFTRTAALELGPHNIRINCINPTVVMTDLGRSCWSDPAKAKPLIEKIPLKRFAEVEEIVNAALYLLSDKASMITGTCLPVDGGYLAV